MDFCLVLLSRLQYLLDFVVNPLDIVDSRFILHVFKQVLSAVILPQSLLWALSLHLLTAKQIPLPPIAHLSISVGRVFFWVPLRSFPASSFIPSFVIFPPVAVLSVFPRKNLPLRHLGHVDLKVLPLLLSEIILSIEQLILLALRSAIIDRGHYLTLSFVSHPFGTPPTFHPSASIRPLI